MFKWSKRIFLFLAVNFLIVISASIVLSLFGISGASGFSRYGTQLDIKSLAIFALVWGFMGAFISLALSRVMAKFSMGVKTIDANTTDATELWLYKTVIQLAEQANLSGRPEVGIFNSPDPNAFATGPSQSRSLVAVSTGLLQAMPKPEVQAVLAHEIAHIKNGDMVTMTLLQGIINAFVIFLSRVIGFFVAQALRSDDQKRASYGVQMIVSFLCEILFAFLGMMIVSWFSRQREYRADAGGASLAGQNNMINALKTLQNYINNPYQMKTSENLASFQISGRQKGGLASLFRSHPPLEDRIKRLEQSTPSLIS